MKQPNNIPAAALEYHRQGRRLTPLKGKVPAVKNWQSFEATRVSIRYWFGSRCCNIGLITGEYVVIDADTEDAERWAQSLKVSGSPAMVRSGGGGTHRFFGSGGVEVRNRQGLHGIKGLDVRGAGGFIVLPPSIHPETGKPYEWLTGGGLPDVETLPVFDPEWLADKRVEPLRKSTEVVCRKVESVRRYVSRIVARCFSGAHNQAFRCACQIAKRVDDFGLAMELYRDWNATNAVAADGVTPFPFSEAELQHKMKDAWSRKLSGTLK